MSEILRGVLGFAVLFVIYGIYGLVRRVTRPSCAASDACGNCAIASACARGPENNGH